MSSVQPQAPVTPRTRSQLAGDTPTSRLLLWLLVGLTSPLLLYMGLKDQTDVQEYQCYALAFWRGAQATRGLAATACLVSRATLATQPFHELPREYGPLALLVFSPPILGPQAWYPLLFGVEMLLIIWGMTWLLWRMGPPGAGLAWIAFVVLGSLVTATARFDLVPAVCVVVALLAIRSGRQGWAAVALALGTLLKIYPALLLPLLLIVVWRGRPLTLPGGAWRRADTSVATHRATLASAADWARGWLFAWRGPVIFAGVVALGVGLAAALNPARVIAPLSFLSARCVEVESLPATLGYLWAWMTGARVGFPYAYGSTCLAAPGLGVASLVCLALGLAGMALTVALYWRGRVSLGLAACLLLCLAMLGGKVFSPQYLLWVSPLVALTYGSRARALLAWGAVCLATTLCYPLSYQSGLLALLRVTPDALVPLTAGARNLLLVALVAWALWRATESGRDSPPLQEAPHHLSVPTRRYSDPGNHEIKHPVHPLSVGRMFVHHHDSMDEADDVHKMDISPDVFCVLGAKQ